MFEWVAGTGLGIDMLPVGDDGDSSEARTPRTGCDSWVPAWGWIAGCQCMTGGCDGATVGISEGWRVVWMDG